MALVFIPVFGAAVLMKSVGGFVFDSPAVVRALQEARLYGDLSELLDQIFSQTPKIAADASEEEKKLSETFWKRDLNQAVREAIPESFFYELAGRWHEGFVTVATGGVDAAWVDFSGVKSKVRSHAERFGADQKIQALNLSPESMERVAGWMKSLTDAVDRVPDQCTLSQIIEAAGGDSRKYQQALEPARRNLERVQWIERALQWAAGIILCIVALVLIGSLRRILLGLGVALLVAGFACKFASDQMGEFFVRKARAQAIVLVEGRPSHARERVLQVTGTLVKHSTHHADSWVYGALALGAALAGAGILLGLFSSRSSGVARS